AIQAAKDALAENGNLTPTDKQLVEQIRNTASASYGTGSDLQRAIQAATAITQGLTGGNLGQALAGGSAPYLAHEISKYLPADQSLGANLMAHAVLGAVVGHFNGNATVGAISAFTAEAAAPAIIKAMGWDKDSLTEKQKQTVSALATLAAGLAGGLVGDSSSSAVAGAQVGKNAVENNLLGGGTEDGQIKAAQEHAKNIMSCADNPGSASCQKGLAMQDALMVAIPAGLGGGLLAAASPEIAAAAKAAIQACAGNVVLCLNNAGIQMSEAIVPGGVGASGAIGIGKTAAEATAAKAEAVAANVAHNAAKYAGLKMDLKTTQGANELVESLRATGNLPANYVPKETAMQNGWKAGKALNNSVPGGQIGGDVFRDADNLLPSAPSRIWREADIGLDASISRSNQPGTRLLYSNDGLLYITTDHYKTATSIGTWK
ncbi:VENN motif pre-toxin domain-containing protein, partial [Yersinia enterocolitica]